MTNFIQPIHFSLFLTQDIKHDDLFVVMKLKKMSICSQPLLYYNRFFFLLK